jgi:hypothetical protein
MSRTFAFVAAAIGALAVAAAAAFWALGDPDPERPSPPATIATTQSTATATGVRSGTPPLIVRPPDATLSVTGGRDVTAGIGTRCWANVCLDAVGPVSNVDAFPISRADRLSISFAAGSPDRRTDRVFSQVSPDGSRVLSDGRLWEALGGLTAPAAAALPPDLPPGRYVWVIQAFWKGKGDVSYAFYVEIQ